ncbi:polysaccharide pyruvyl transferase family protein, partial [bacterium]|nr:polysaccharide pyruvyl transferase family protein [bacterium]
GTRMHANIFALSSNVPAIVIAYRYKSHGLMQLLGLDDWIIEIEEINSEKLISLLLKLWNSRNKVTQEISSSMPLIKKECQKSIEVTYNDFLLLINKDHFLS